MEAGEEEEEEEEDNELVVLDPSHVRHVFTLMYCITVIFLEVYCISFLNGEDESESASHWDNILNFVTVVVQ